MYCIIGSAHSSFVDLLFVSMLEWILGLILIFLILFLNLHEIYRICRNSIKNSTIKESIILRSSSREDKISRQSHEGPTKKESILLMGMMAFIELHYCLMRTCYFVGVANICCFIFSWNYFKNCAATRDGVSTYTSEKLGFISISTYYSSLFFLNAFYS